MLMTLGGWVVTTASETMRLMYDMKAMTTWMMTSTTAVTTIDTNVLYKKSVDYLLEQEFGSVRNELGNYLLDHEDPIRLLHFLGVVVVTSSIMLPILSKLLTAQVQRHRQRQKERSFSQSCFKQRLTTQLGPYWEIDRNTPSYDPEQSQQRSTAVAWSTRRLESQLGQYWDSPTSLTSLPPPNTPHPNEFEREEEEERRTLDAIPDIARVLTFDEDEDDDDTENDFTNNADMDSDDDANADNRSRSTTASFNTINDRDDRDDDDDDAWNIDTVITTMTEEFQIIMNEWNIPTPMKTKRVLDDGSVVELSSPLPPPPTETTTASPHRPSQTPAPRQTPITAPSTPVPTHDQEIANDFMLSVFKRKFTRRTIN
jgi:hypothetical protein